MRPGVRMGIDLGQRRIGVARSDASGLLAVPETTVARGAGDVTALVALAQELEAVEILVGLPLSMSGESGAAADGARIFAAELAAVAPVPVRLVDERLSTVSAQRSLHESGRTTRNSRSVIDQAAAVVIVQSALDRERSTGEPAGEVVTVS